MSTFAQLGITTIHDHDSNVRRHVEIDEEIVTSITAVGILTPVAVAPHPDLDGEWVLIAGHRRTAAARKAGLDTVPAVIRDDLVTEAQQVAAMLVENLHRSDLTPVEEAAAYEQLELFGLDVAAIAAETGRSTSTVKARLKLTRLPEATREKLHERQLTLTEAETLLKFADDPDALKTLERYAGTSNFAYTAERLLDDRRKKERAEQLIAEFEALGATKTDRWSNELDRQFRNEALHLPSSHSGKCLAYYHPSYSEPYLTCLDPTIHEYVESLAAKDDEDGTETSTEDYEEQRRQRDAEWEAQKAAREAERAAQVTASRLRIHHIRDHLASLLTPAKPTKQSKALAAYAKALLPLAAVHHDDLTGSTDIAVGAGIDTDLSYTETRQALRTWTGEFGSDAEAIKAFAVFLAALVEPFLDDSSRYDDPEDATEALTVWDWLEGTGHDMCEVDERLRDDLITYIAEANNEDDDD